MSPLFDTPNRGYADYQRIGNFDTGVLFSDNAVHPSGTLITPTLNVSRFMTLVARMTVVGAPVVFTATWYADAAATISLGGRLIVLSPNMGGVAWMRLMNLGPFVILQWNTTAHVSFSCNVVVGASNRISPLEFIPVNPQIVDVQGAAIGAGATLTNFPLDYYDGPVRVFAIILGQAGRLDFYRINVTGGNDFFDQQAFPVGGIAFDTVWPAGAVRVDITNNGAAASTYILAVTPSMTGAT